MEYLSLRDIPHRQYNPLHSRRMAPSHSVEGSLGDMAAAVSDDHTISSCLYTPRPTFHLPMPRSTLCGTFPHLGGDLDLRQELPPKDHTHPHPAPLDYLDPQPTTTVGNPCTYHYEQHFPEHIRKTGHERRSPTPRPHDLDSDCQHHSSCVMEQTHSFGPESVTIIRSGHPHNYRYMHNSIEGELRKKSLSLTHEQNRHMRHSPPIQPGEQSYSHHKLPSFEEVGLHLTPEAFNADAESSVTALAQGMQLHRHRHQTAETDLLTTPHTPDHNLKMWLGRISINVTLLERYSHTHRRPLSQYVETLDA
jgi:hypothetical protein